MKVELNFKIFRGQIENEHIGVTFFLDQTTNYRLLVLMQCS